jgi:hypothetical protein
VIANKIDTKSLKGWYYAIPYLFAIYLFWLEHLGPLNVGYYDATAELVRFVVPATLVLIFSLGIDGLFKFLIKKKLYTTAVFRTICFVSGSTLFLILFCLSVPHTPWFKTVQACLFIVLFGSIMYSLPADQS